MSRPRETRFLHGDLIEISDDRESVKFRDFKSEVGKTLKRLKSATLRAIREDFERRRRSYHHRWVLDALESLRADGEIYFDTSHAQYTKYVFGKEPTARVLPKPKITFVGSAKPDWVNLGVREF